MTWLIAGIAFYALLSLLVWCICITGARADEAAEKLWNERSYGDWPAIPTVSHPIAYAEEGQRNNG